MKAEKGAYQMQLLKIVFIALVIMALVIAVILIYSYPKTSGEEVSPEAKSNETEINNSGKEPNIIQRIFGSGGGGSGGAGSSGGGGGDSGGSGGGSSDGGTAKTYTTDLTICTNANNDNLCDGLDLAYGDGYKDACCSERGLCC